MLGATKGERMDFFGSVFFIALIIFIIVRVNAARKGGASAPQRTQVSRSNPSGLLAFQEKGTLPKTDSHGRVIVKLKGSASGIRWGVNLSHLDYKLANKLAGRPKEDEEFEKTIKVRLRPDTDSQFANSVLVETMDEKHIGWILKDASDDAMSVLNQLGSALKPMLASAKANGLVFEVSARISGYWEDTSDTDSPTWEADFEQMEIRIATPAEIEID